MKDYYTKIDRIIDELAVDPRWSNAEISRELGVAPVTVSHVRRYVKGCHTGLLRCSLLKRELPVEMFGYGHPDSREGQRAWERSSDRSKGQHTAKPSSVYVKAAEGLTIPGMPEVLIYTGYTTDLKRRRSETVRPSRFGYTSASPLRAASAAGYGIEIEGVPGLIKTPRDEAADNESLAMMLIPHIPGVLTLNMEEGDPFHYAKTLDALQLWHDEVLTDAQRDRVALTQLPRHLANNRLHAGLRRSGLWMSRDERIARCLESMRHFGLIDGVSRAPAHLRVAESLDRGASATGLGHFADILGTAVEALKSDLDLTYNQELNHDQDQS